MARLNRRDFLKALGLGGTVSAASACGLDDNRYFTPVEQILPYVVKPEVVVPGTPTFFATTVTSGPHAYPVTARHRDGRVIMVGANTRAPMPTAIPTPALLALQRHYNPDRFTAPRAREGSAWSDLDWQAGTDRLARAVQEARAAGKKVVWLGPYASGSIVELLREYTQGEAIFWEPLGPEAEATASEILFGRRVLPAWRIDEARYVLSFGAPFLSPAWGGGELEAQYAAARNPNVGGFVTRFALVSPHMDQTGANCDDWYGAAPGSQAAVALGIAKLIAAKTGYQGPGSAILAQADPGEAALDAGMDPADMDAIASQFVAASQAGGAVAFPGGPGAGGVDLAVATWLINLASGNGGRTFGLGPHYEGPIDSFQRVATLVEEMSAGNVGVLLLGDTDPLYTLPKALGFDAAMAQVPLVASLSSWPSATSAAAHVVLPTSSPFEDWGDEEPQAGLILLRQPAMSPLHDTRSLGDVLLATGRAAGAQAAPATEPAPDGTEPGETVADPSSEGTAPVALGFGPETWQDYVRQRIEGRLAAGGAPFTTGEGWHLALADGFVRTGEPALAAPDVTATAHAFDAAPGFQGGGEFFLHAYPHPMRLDGRFSNEPWAQETPDPTTGQTWDSWLEVAPEAAERLGLKNNDEVTVTTDAGSVTLGVEVYPGLRPDTVALAFGQGHAIGRYAGYGVNVVDLLAVASGPTGAFAWQQAKAALARTGKRANLTSVIGADRLEGRNLGVWVPAEQIAEVGDAEAEHPGSLTGIHHLPFDDRLLDAGITDFYEAPDHPVHRWAMTVDTNACNGCGACVIACYAENNLPVVGKDLVRRGKEMNWLRINRYWVDTGGQTTAHFQPMLCQHCTRAPCESVCPVLATYHNIEGLNAMVYNRCVGTRYCANNCPYQVRRFNFHSYAWPEPFNLQLNPDVVVRTMGVMEKCTFCVQRTRAVKGVMKDRGEGMAPVPDEMLRELTACAEACPSQAITFGNLKDEASVPHQSRKSARSYLLLEELRTEPAINYLAKASWRAEQADSHGTELPAGDAHGSADREHHEPHHPAAAPEGASQH